MEIGQARLARSAPFWAGPLRHDEGASAAASRAVQATHALRTIITKQHTKGPRDKFPTHQPPVTMATSWSGMTNTDFAALYHASAPPAGSPAAAMLPPVAPDSGSADGDSTITPPTPSTPTPTGATGLMCGTCMVDLVSRQHQRHHYTSAYHAENSMRKTAGLGVLSEAEYCERAADGRVITTHLTPEGLLRSNQSEDGSDDDASGGVADHEEGAVLNRCRMCAKTFSSGRALRHHLASRKHRRQAKIVMGRGGGASYAASSVSAGAGAGADGGLIVDEYAEEQARRELQAAHLAVVSTSHDSASAGAHEGTPALADSASADASTASWLCIFCSRGNTVSCARPAMGAAGAAAAAAAETEGSWGASEASTRVTRVAATSDAGAVATSSAVSAVLDHMRSAHGFNVPESDCVCDMLGLLRHVAAKVHTKAQCLRCPHARTFASPRSAIAHMADVGHCRLRAEEDEAFEYAPFYDFAMRLEGPTDAEAARHVERVHAEETEGSAAAAAATAGATLLLRIGDSDDECVVPAARREPTLRANKAATRKRNQALRKRIAAVAEELAGKASVTKGGGAGDETIADRAAAPADEAEAARAGARRGSDGAVCADGVLLTAAPEDASVSTSERARSFGSVRPGAATWLTAAPQLLRTQHRVDGCVVDVSAARAVTPEERSLAMRVRAQQVAATRKQYASGYRLGRKGNKTLRLRFGRQNTHTTTFWTLK